MIEQNWLEFTIALLDFSSLLILLMLLTLVNVGLKWLPSLNKISLFLGLFFFIKTALIIADNIDTFFTQILYLFTLPLILLVGPVITGFTRSTLAMQQEPILDKQSIILLLIGYIHILPLFFLTILNIEQPSPFLLNILDVASISFIVLFVLSSSFHFIRMLWRLYRGSLYSVGYSDTTYQWLKGVWFATSFIWLALLHAVIFGVIYEPPLPLVTFLSLLDILVLFYLMLVTAKYSQKPQINNEIEHCQKNIKYQKTALKQTHAESILQSIDTVMVEEKLFLDNNLSVEKLSSMINSQPQYVSQAINQYRHINFYELLAGYRIDFAKQALISEPDKSILDIAMAAGFNAKSTFNNTFKKFTGLTPTQFKKQQA